MFLDYNKKITPEEIKKLGDSGSEGLANLALMFIPGA